MMKPGLIIAVIIALTTAVGGAVVLTKKSANNNNPAPASTNTAETTQQGPTTNTENMGANTVAYTNEGFNPAILTVKSGTTITIRNDSSRVLEFDSAPHPEHTDNPELNVGAISPGRSKTITVTKTGRHGFHNHLNDSHTGTLTVQ